MFAHKELSHKVHEPIRAENARHILVWVYRERCEHILYAFWVSHAVSVLILRRESFSSSAITHPVCSSVKTSRMRQTRKFAHAWWGLDCDLPPNEKKTKPEFQLRRFPQSQYMRFQKQCYYACVMTLYVILHKALSPITENNRVGKSKVSLLYLYIF